MDSTAIAELTERLRQQVRRVVVGQSEVVSLLLAALLAEGHVLLESVPGTAKTLLARAFAASLALGFKRIQFTPDLMPGDILGTNLFNFQTNEFRFSRGPIFTQLLLADEINRTPPKTQAALLQAMQERTVTVDGLSHDLGSGFMVVATQNPIEQEGTYPLPEAQLDRFLFKVVLDYPSRDEEREIVRLHGHRTSMPDLEAFALEPVADLEAIGRARAAVAAVELSDEIAHYAVDIVRATREDPALRYGASPRSANMLASAARAWAALAGRGYVIPDDVKAVVGPTLAHRLLLAPGAEMEGATPHAALSRIVSRLAAPR